MSVVLHVKRTSHHPSAYPPPAPISQGHMLCTCPFLRGYGGGDKGVGGFWKGGSFSKQPALVKASTPFGFFLFFGGKGGLAAPVMMQTWAQTLYGQYQS